MRHFIETIETKSAFRVILAFALAIVVALIAMEFASFPAVAYADDGASAAGAASATVTIVDLLNPLAAFDPDPVCGIHGFMVIGIVATIIYGGVVVARRLIQASALKAEEARVLGLEPSSQEQSNAAPATLPEA